MIEINSKTNQSKKSTAISNNIRPLNILLADDGSEHANAAIELLCDLPLVPESSVFALGVIPTLDISKHNIVEASLEHAYTCLREKGLEVFTELKGGVPAGTINEFAEIHNFIDAPVSTYSCMINGWLSTLNASSIDDADS